MALIGALGVLAMSAAGCSTLEVTDRVGADTPVTQARASASSSATARPPTTGAPTCRPAAPTVESLQHGTIRVASNGTTSVPIVDVAPDRAMLLFSARGAGGRPVQVELRGRLGAASTVEFERSTDENPASPLDVDWSVVEFACGVRVQRGMASLETTTTTVPIERVSPGRAFVTWSLTSWPTSTYWDLDDAPVVEIASPASLEIRSGYAKGHRLWWQVVEFLDPAAASVQVARTALRGDAVSTTVPLATAVDPARSFVLVSGTSTAWETNADIGRQLTTARLSGTGEVTVERGAPSGATAIAMPDVLVQVVELRNGTVRTGTADLPAGTGTVTVLVPGADPSHSSAVLAGMGAAGTSTGLTSDVSTDDPGSAMFTATLGAGQLVLRREQATSAARVDWSVVRWG